MGGGIQDSVDFVLDTIQQSSIDSYDQERAGEEAIMGQYDINESKKTKLTADQVNNSELRMGIRVEMEHTKDPKKAEKIALDHLAENPFYYTQLKLSGVDVQAKPSKEKKAIAKKKNESELVDKANQMKPVKGVEKVKASANKAHKETNKPVAGISSMSFAAKTVRGVKKMEATGEKMKKVAMKEVRLNDFPGETPGKIAQQIKTYVDSNPTLKRYSNEITLQSKPDGFLKYGYWKSLPDDALKALSLQFNVEEDSDYDEDSGTIIFYKLTPKYESPTQSGIAKFLTKEKLAEIIREELKEYFDGRDNLTNVTGEND
jgi:hypothetical protein